MVLGNVMRNLNSQMVLWCKVEMNTIMQNTQKITFVASGSISEAPLHRAR